MKTQEPQNLLEATYHMYAEEIQERTNHIFTPVQASAYHNIKNNRVFSFSAPTSIGKSYVFRELLKEYTKDVVIIVSSRALLAEYMHNIKAEFKNDKSILILQFIENINISNTSRRIYIITPERSGNLFKLKNSLNIELFLFDDWLLPQPVKHRIIVDSSTKNNIFDFFMDSKLLSKCCYGITIYNFLFFMHVKQ